jgi:uncharacterized protein YjbI with pentapeptide repeats
VLYSASVSCWGRPVSVERQVRSAISGRAVEELVAVAYSPETVGQQVHEADLSFATLHWTDLSKAGLRETNLIGADLLGAKLPSAKLGGADLTAVRLSEADLSGADLTGALLGEADLVKCNLQGASLIGTYLHS